MDIGTIMTRTKLRTQAYHEKVQMVVNDTLLMSYIDNAVIQIKRDLKRPVRVTDLTMTVGERGLNLPTNFLDFIDEYSVRLIHSTDDADSDGYPFPIIGEERRAW